MKSSERLKTYRKLEEIFKLDDIQEVESMKNRLVEIYRDMNSRAQSLPRDYCSDLCACSGACKTDEAKYLEKQSTELYLLCLEFFNEMPAP